jgi:hypothetical protein
VGVVKLYFKWAILAAVETLISVPHKMIGPLGRSRYIAQKAMGGKNVCERNPFLKRPWPSYSSRLLFLLVPLKLILHVPELVLHSRPFSLC